MTWFSNGSVCGWLVIMVWLILVHHAFQFVGGVGQFSSVVIHVGASWFSSWLLVIEVWFSCVLVCHAVSFVLSL